MSRPDLSAAENVLQNLRSSGKKETHAESPAVTKAPKPEATPVPKAKLKTNSGGHAGGFKHTRTSPRGK